VLPAASLYLVGAQNAEASPLLVKEAYTNKHAYADVRREKDREEGESVYYYTREEDEEDQHEIEVEETDVE
jgi:hypothetical protein